MILNGKYNFGTGWTVFDDKLQTSFPKNTNLLTNRYVRIEARKAIAITLNWRVVLKVDKKENIIQRLSKCRKWSWTQRKSNLKVLDEVSESRKFIQALEKRVKFIAHILRHNQFVTNIIQGKVLAKRGRGRPKKQYFECINHRRQICKYSDMKGAALDMREWLYLEFDWKPFNFY